MENTITINRLDPIKSDNTYSKMFIKNCCKDLKQRGCTECFNLEQIEALRKFYPKLRAKLNIWYYEVRI